MTGGRPKEAGEVQPARSAAAGSNDRREIFWTALSHQRPENRERCIALPLGPVRVALCSRCVGLYSTMLVALAAQLVWRAGPLGTLDWLVALVGAAPALLDWGSSHLGRKGSNAVRLATGALLGAALGRSLYLYFRDPLAEVFWIQAFLLASGAIAFELVRRLDLGSI